MAEEAQPGKGKKAAGAEGCSAVAPGAPRGQGSLEWQIGIKWRGE